ncbi:PepSY-like domain-containing protein [Flavobacterium hauense]
MKTVFKLILTLALFSGFTANAQKRNITIKELPAAAQTFLSQNFPKQTAAYAVEDKGMISTDYEIMLSNGVEIEFDGKGNWEEIDGNKNALPHSVLPKAIADYADRNYKGQGIEKIEKEKWGYKVEFLNDVELRFDSNGKFLRIDD